MLHELYHLRADAPLTRRPGEQMSYCGFGYLMLSEIVRRTSGMGYADFARKRIFEPLGMSDTFYKLLPDLHMRFVRRPADIADQIEDPSTQDRPSGSVGGYSTAHDLAVFCQMFLNGGSYSDAARVLSPATVSEMTRNQIPGVPSQFKEDFEREGSRGYDWDVKGSKKPRFHGSLDSPRAFTHQGAGGVSIMADPAYELVVIFLSVSCGITSCPARRPSLANGKRERLNRTIGDAVLRDRVYDCREARTAARANFQPHYNARRRHMALGGLTPFQRLVECTPGL